jgi:penicillin-binding protein 1A
MLDVEKGKYYRFIRRLWILFICGWVLFAGYLVAVNYNLFGLFGPMPGFKVLEDPRNDLASEVYSADGVLLGKYFQENRTPVEFEQISPALIQALVATEDARFYKHSGIDARSWGRVFFKSILLFQDEGGGSTLSQQLAKNLYNMRREENKGLLGNVPLVSTLIIKTKEWITAIKLEQNFTKREIITMYLNTVDFGSTAYGIKSAAKTYFQKSPDKLNTEEAAVLVGMLKSPSIYHPVRHPQRALTRRNTVLAQMHKYDFLSAAAFDSLKNQPLTLNYEVENPNRGLATYFRAYMRSELLRWAGERGLNLYTDGLKIYTTIDSRMQQYAEEAVQAHMASLQEKFFRHWEGRNPWIGQNGQEIENYLESAAEYSLRYKELKEKYGDDEDSIRVVMNTPVKMRVFSWNGTVDTLMSPMDSIRYYKHFLHTGFMSMEPGTGFVKAWVGGIDFRHFQYDHVRQSRRQPGSVFKPFIYAAAIDYANYVPCDELPDVSPVFPEYGNWMVRNYSRTYSDTLLTLREAMAQSKNTIPAFLIKQMGTATVLDYARKLGISSPMRTTPAIALGTEPVSVYEMVSAYGTFVNNGVWTKPMYLTRIEDRNGNVLADFAPETREVLSPEKAYLMLHMLRGSLEEEGGSARALYNFDAPRGNQIGAKTGTSQQYADGWFMGVTKDLVSGVWVGGEDMSIHFRDANGLGSRTALPIWGMFMDKVYADTTLGITKGAFKRPPNVNVTLNCQEYQANKAIMVKDSTQHYIAPNADSLKNEGML